MSWPYTLKGVVSFQNIIQQEQTLPFLDKLNYGVDLMVEDPEEEILKWYSFGARRFIVHVESVDGLDVLERIILTYKKKGLSEVCVAIGIETPVETIRPIIKNIESVQFMGISKIGYQGEKFDEQVFDKIACLRQMHKNVIISVDGGVSKKTVSRLVEAGATRLVSGSAIFGDNNIEEAIKTLKSV